MAQAHILVVDDEPDIRQLVREILEDEGYAVSTAADAADARLIYSQQKPDLVLLDIWMPDIDGISLLKEWSTATGLSSQVVIMSGHGTLETAVEATRLGAFDFIQKPLSLAKLLATVHKALASGTQAGAKPTNNTQAAALEPLGKSPAMQLLRTKAQQAAKHDLPVLISGETGSGREILARYIHQLSSASGELQVLDHGRLKETGAAAYLLGTMNTGEPIPGLFSQAAGGTLFIPQLEKLSADSQQIIEGVLSTGTYSPRGSTSAKPIACRFISSASDRLEQLRRAGQFLDSLYLHLNVLPLKIPALRARREDIPELVRFYSDWFPNQQNLPYRQFSVAVQNRMRNHDWPGNVRELRNLVQHLLVLGGDGEVTVQEVEAAIGETAGPDRPDNGEQRRFDLPLREAREQFERDYLIYQLKKAGGSVGKLSTSVGMERTHLYRKLRSLGINPKSVTYNEDKK